MISRLRNIVYTISTLTPRQIVYRILPNRPARLIHAIEKSCAFDVEPLWFTPDHVQFNDSQITMECLNRSVVFHCSVDWASDCNGLLWNYHIHYLNWLQVQMVDQEHLQGLYDQYLAVGYGQGAGLDPYPTSLRIINTIKAVCGGRLAKTNQLLESVRRDTENLVRRIEYHLLGNHLLENGFGLLWGGFFLSDDRVFRIGSRIVLSQLHEQILYDGGHFERSPMYHSLMLWRVLDSVNLLSGTCHSGAKGTLSALRRYAGRMSGWLSNFPISKETGHMNDSAPGMVPSRENLLEYAGRLSVVPEGIEFSDSGYRVLTSGSNQFEVLADVGSVGPRYIPGHAHAGTLGFELYQQGSPVLVDTGISTYEVGHRRSWERSTMAHNTVVVGGLNSSEVWAAFRVARRARVTLLTDTKDMLTASHDGYRTRLGVTHTRTWSLSEGNLGVKDKLSGRGARRIGGIARFIFHPDVNVRSVGSDVILAGASTFTFDGARRLLMERAKVSSGFNKLRETTALSVFFSGELITRVSTGGS